ncbi:MAG: M28 family peptidase [Candidatus Heimdallarchaeota archaeon]|nr:M28 family peptidase [Candidatus Heimdallarchaeota archaeon]
MKEGYKPRIDPSGKDMLVFIEKICNEIGPRIAGTKEEDKVGNLIFNDFKQYTDETLTQEFTCHPGGFLDFIWVTAGLYILGFLAFFFIHSLVSIILVFGALAIYSLQQNFLFEAVDFFFPKITSFHVIGKIKPMNKPKHLIILSGHHDSAYEFPLLSKLGQKSSYVIYIAISIVVLNIILGIIKILAPVEMIQFIDTLQLILFAIGTLVVLVLAIFLRSNKGVLGANDNLTAVAAIRECGKYLYKNKPENTEVWLVSFAGEEHMRGSKRFVQKFGPELKHRNVMLFNLECLSAETFLIATKEVMFLATHSKKVIQLGEKAANNLKIPVKIEAMNFAGSDAANFSRKGLDATTLFGLAETGVPTYWHTLEDTPDKLSGPSIARGAEIALEFVDIVDKLD